MTLTRQHLIGGCASVDPAHHRQHAVDAALDHQAVSAAFQMDIAGCIFKAS
jgi:hypothetical protein